MDTNSKWQYVLLGVGAFLVIVVLVYFLVAASLNVPLASLLTSPFSEVAPVPTPTPVYFNTINRGGPVAKSIGTTTIDYWLYGHFASIDRADAQGIHGQFVLQDDPLKNFIPIVILNHQEIYKLLVYSQGFGQASTLNMLDAASMQKTISETASTLELRVQFSKTNVIKSDVALMNSLEAVNQGDWTKLTKTTLLVDSVGVSKTP